LNTLKVPAGLRQARVPLPEHLLGFLQAEVARFSKSISVPRPWHYSELHNPWSRAAAVFDSWGFLDVCQSSTVIENVGRLIGPDIVLFDSQWLPDRWHPIEAESALESDAHRFPVDPPVGVTVLIAVAGVPRGILRVDYRDSKLGTAAKQQVSASLELEPGTILVLDSRLAYRVRCARSSSVVPAALAMRYFPASSRYSRDPTAPVHRTLTERYPLINYARLPLWLVNGEDRADNDFVTGFNVRAGYWTNSRW
jgi:hypothetical protein